MKRTAARLPALLLALALLVAALAPGPRAAADEYGDATLEAFAVVTIEISRRIEAWRPHIESEADEEVRDALIEEANADVFRALEEAEDIGAEEYQAIYDAAREDEALRGRIEKILADLLRGPRVPRAE